MKAEAAEQRALSARDDTARDQAWREAAHRWERAADREKDDKRRTLYTEKANAARKSADEPEALADTSVSASAPAGAVAPKQKPRLLH